MGITLVHEHIFIDGSCWFVESEDKRFRRLANLDVTLESLDDIRRAYRYNKMNWVLDDEETAEEELRLFRAANGRTIIDVTPDLPRRNPAGLKKLAKRVGIHIVAGCGYYVQASHPSYISSSSIEQISDRIARELTEGMAGTRIRAGIIGEIGISPDAMKPDEEKVLRAAARAQVETGTVVTVHTFEPFHPERRQGLKVLEILEEEEAKMDRVYMSHIDACRNRSGPLGLDIDYIEQIAEKGAYVSFDGFGSWEWPVGSSCYDITYPTDFERAVAIKELIGVGLGRKIVLSHDVCLKTNLRRFGGGGYSHLLVNVPRVFERYGMGKRELSMMLVENPRRLLG